MIERNDIWKYAEKRMKDIDCADLPTAETHTEKQQRMLSNYAKEELVFGIHLALIIGFANGVEWERRDSIK